jgi:hypothetical protein
MRTSWAADADRTDKPRVSLVGGVVAALNFGVPMLTWPGVTSTVPVLR